MGVMRLELDHYAHDTIPWHDADAALMTADDHEVRCALEIRKQAFVDGASALGFQVERLFKAALTGNVR